MSFFNKSLFTKPVAWLLLLNIATRGAGIWFHRVGWDEEQFYFGGKGILRWLWHFLNTGTSTDVSNDLVSIYGPAGKYLSALGLAFYEVWYHLFGISSRFELFTAVRIFSSFIPAVLSVILLLKIARILQFSSFAQHALLLFSAFAFRWVESAHYATPDSLLTMSVLWALYEVLCWHKNQKINILIRLSVAIAIAVACKINMGLLLWGWMNVFMLFFMRTFPIRIRIKWILIFNTFFFIAALVLLFPYIVYLSEYVYEVRFHMAEFPFIVKGHPLAYFLFKPAWGIGWTLLFPALAAIFIKILRIRSQSSQWLLLLGWLLLTLIYLSTAQGAIPRWEIPAIPIFLLLAAWFFEEIRFRFAVKKIYIAMVALVIVAATVYPAKHVVQFDVALMYPEVRGPSVQEIQQSFGCTNVYLNFSLKIHSVSDFLKSDCQCAVLDANYWNDLDNNGIPGFLEDEKANASFIGQGSMDIRRYIRSNWQPVADIVPRFYTNWSFNPALLPKSTFYIKPSTLPK